MLSASRGWKARFWSEASAILDVSIKTLKGFVSRGEIRYIDVGNGLKKKRRMFTESDLLEFIERRGQRDIPCRCISANTARSITSISYSRVIGFTALRD